MRYNEFLEGKKISVTSRGVDVCVANDGLFDWQKAVVKWALAKGRAGIFADTGLGKTRMQVEWAAHVPGRVLILSPLAVAAQTVREASIIGVDVVYARRDTGEKIIITNYEMMDHFDFSVFSGVVLDESSILKSHTSKTRTKLIDECQQIPFRLSCTATPSPNDFMELGNQSEFIGVMTRTEMLAMFFVHDGGETSKWRLKGHGATRFWEWMAEWAAFIRKPSDLGFSDDGYDLPSLNISTSIIEVTADTQDGELFAIPATSLMERRRAKRRSIECRAKSVAELVNNSPDQWLVWCHLNDESALLAKLIECAVEIKGADTPDHKEKSMLAFSDSSIRVLVTKPSIAGFGMNWQQCHNMAFVGMDDSFEKFYQAVRRCWRFGQSESVNVHIFAASTEGPVLENIHRKEQQHRDMGQSMADHMIRLMRENIMGGTSRNVADYDIESESGDNWELRLGDCVDVSKTLSDQSIDYSVFSPPFASLYTYSNSDRDMGNSRTDREFYDHFKFLIAELYRVTCNGRLTSFHCMNLPTSKQNNGYIGIRDFRGELIRLFESEGWIYHSEVCIWKDPVTAMQRTKALGLLHKQLKKDSAMSRQGIADYVVTMRKPGENTKPITNTADTFPVEVWQEYASPVWSDINATRTLQYRDGRENSDERHICPLQLDVIERCIKLWSRPGDLVFSPFAGIGSEGVVANQMGRKFIGVELKRSYFELAKANLIAESAQGDMFSGAANG